MTNKPELEIIVWCPLCELILDPINTDKKILFLCEHNKGFQLIIKGSPIKVNLDVVPD